MEEVYDLSQRLVEACHAGDYKAATALLGDPLVDVNYIGTVILRGDTTRPEYRIGFEEFKTQVTPLFIAAYLGHEILVVNLLNAGANVNEKLFRGYATTAAVREGKIQILEILVNSGAGEAACEDALREASYLGRARHAQLLMGLNMIRPHVAAHAIVNASCRGFVDFVDTLIKCEVDINAIAQVLLRSSKPSLHVNAECSALVGAIVSRQVSVVQLLLENNKTTTDSKVKLGAWSWDIVTGEEFRVGVGLAEPYGVTWCAVEYFESTGAILRMLLRHTSPNIPHLGRTLIQHAILCGNAKAVEVLISCGADVEYCVETVKQISFYPIHLASRLGFAPVLEELINGGCNLDSKTEAGDTAFTICVRYNHLDCLRLLASAGADENDKEAEENLARNVVLNGAFVKKHRKNGRKNPHYKMLQMVAASGVLSWGESSKRNVICKRAEVGPSSEFRWARQSKLDADEEGIFRVVTTKNKEYHFVCCDGNRMAELWARGIMLVTNEAFFGNDV